MLVYADDTTVICHDNTDVPDEEEFQHITDWSVENNLTIYLRKSKEIVFHRPNIRKCILPAPLAAI